MISAHGNHNDSPSLLIEEIIETGLPLPEGEVRLSDY